MKVVIELSASDAQRTYLLLKGIVEQGEQDLTLGPEAAFDGCPYIRKTVNAVGGIAPVQELVGAFLVAARAASSN